MKTAVISYSLTGNNSALAKSVARELGAAHIEVTEAKKRTNWTIATDLIFGKCPKVTPSADIVNSYETIVLVGPVWMSCVASPLHCYIKEIKRMGKEFSFVSISGGADHDNPKLIDDIVKRAGRAPKALVDMHIADLLPKEPVPTREMTSAYKVTEDDVKALTKTAVEKLMPESAGA